MLIIIDSINLNDLQIFGKGFANN